MHRGDLGGLAELGRMTWLEQLDMSGTSFRRGEVAALTQMRKRTATAKEP